jgi:hypothetical protein
LLQWSLVAPLASVAVTSLYRIARSLGRGQAVSLAAALGFGLASPWWGSASVLYHDSMAVALILIAVDLWLSSAAANRTAAQLRTLIAGVLLGWSVFTTYLVIPIVGVLVLVMLTARRQGAAALLLGFLPVAGLLPLMNFLAFGSPVRTGYSAFLFEVNYPHPFDLRNILEKAYFYLLSPRDSVTFMWPVFGLAAVNLLHGKVDLGPKVRWSLVSLVGVHLLFCMTMPSNGDVGWGSGRFVLPVFPGLALAIPGLRTLQGWAAAFHRPLLLGTFLYSGFHGLAAAYYGMHLFGEGVRLSDHLAELWGAAYLALPLLCLLCGYFVVGVRDRATSVSSLRGSWVG